MTQALTKPVTYEEFIKWFSNSGKRYELHDGVIVEMAPPTGDQILRFNNSMCQYSD
jgi:Uma2 family endonuclease